jgi:amino-acid N-acetyltransferase
MPLSEQPYSAITSTFDPANSIREVFTYIHRFKGSIFVLKIEDSLLYHPLFPVLIKDITLLKASGIHVIIVPGVKKTIDTKLKQFNLNSNFHNGIRITTPEVLPLVESAALEVSQYILNMLTANGSNGVMGNWVQARTLGVVDGIDFGCSGKIDKIQSGILQELKQDFIPILANIGWNKVGIPYNINSTELATRICTDLKARKLFFIGLDEGIKASDVVIKTSKSGIPVNENGIINSLDIKQAESLLSDNPALSWNLKDYLVNSIAACKAGVNRVHLISGLSQGSVLQEVFSSRGEGTMVYSNEYSSIRPALIEDIPDMLRVMEDYILKQYLLVRSEDDLIRQIEDFIVYDIDRSIYGCGALHLYPDQTGEIAAIAVDPSYATSGVGRIIVKALILKAKEQKLKRVFLLTVQALDWFFELGFKEGKLSELPKKKQETYSEKRKSKIMIMDLD